MFNFIYHLIYTYQYELHTSIYILITKPVIEIINS